MDEFFQNYKVLKLIQSKTDDLTHVTTMREIAFVAFKSSKKEDFMLRWLIAELYQIFKGEKKFH
jgi:hypothetical protein